jgi:hypothetical protein
VRPFLWQGLIERNYQQRQLIRRTAVSFPD